MLENMTGHVDEIVLPTQSNMIKTAPSLHAVKMPQAGCQIPDSDVLASDENSW